MTLSLKASAGSGVLVCLLSGPLQADAQEARSVPAPTIEVTEIASDAPVYGTFHGNIPHVVANNKGIFVAYLSHEEPSSSSKDTFYTRPETWTLKRSIDGGRTFSTLFSGTMHKPPEIETDKANNIYLFGSNYSSDDKNRDMEMYIFKAEDNYSHPTQVRFAKEAAGKFTAIYDKGRHQFYYIGYIETPFLAINMNGGVIRQERLFVKGRIANVEYPFMAMDDGRLYIAWTTTPVGDCGGTPQNWHCSIPPYYSIHFIYSDDGGGTWYAPGRTEPLKLPIAPDTDGPAPNIVPANYLGQQTAFLAGFTVTQGVAHFMYMVRPEKKELYQSYNVTPFRPVQYQENSRGKPPTGKFGGNGFIAHSIYGVFSHDDRGDLYAIVNDDTKQDKNIPHSSPLVVLRSSDNGASWSEVANSVPFGSIFAINAPRTVSSLYGIIGVFTASETGSASVPNTHQVYFFRVK